MPLMSEWATRNADNMPAPKINVALTRQLVERILSSAESNSPEEEEELRQQLLRMLAQTLSARQELDEEDLNRLIRKYDSKEIRKLKTRIKGLVEKNALKALRELKKLLREDRSLYDDVVGLIARYNRIDRYLNKGTVPYSEARLEFTRIDNAVLVMVNELEKDDLR